MRTFGIIHILFIVIAFLVCQCVQAQDFLITTKGDTVNGTLKPLFFGSDKKVQVTDTNKKKTTYSMFQVASFRFKDETYQPVKGPAGYTFMKLLKGGYLSLMAFQLENQVNYDGRYLLKKDGKGTEVPNLSFKKVMVAFLNDCPSVSVKIENGELSKRDLEKIVDDYNSCISDKTVEQKFVKSEVTPVVPADKERLAAWENLEQKVNGHTAFDGKENIQEMIAEIKKKVTSREKVPNFLVQGLKESLTLPELQDDLNKAIQSLQ